MARSRNAGWVGALCGMALAGCGGSSSSSAPSSAKALCERLAEEETRIYAHCANQSVPYYLSFDMVLDCEGFGEAQEAGRIAYHPDEAGACLAALEEVTCAEAAQAFGKGYFLDLSGLPASCQGAIEAKVEAGGACNSVLNYECVDGYCDIQSMEACFLEGSTCRSYVAPDGDCSADRCAPGYACSGDVCVASPPVTILEEGGDCSVDYTLCDDGLRCSSGTCVARTAASGACEESYECLEGLRCIEDACTAPYGVGHECAGGDCAEGLYCNEEALCAASPGLGEGCATPPSGDQVQCVDSFCDDTATPAPVCAAFYEPGQPCFLHNDELRFLTACGPGYACYPITFSSSYEWGVCGRMRCAVF